VGATVKRQSTIVVAGWLWISVGLLAQPVSPDSVLEKAFTQRLVAAAIERTHHTVRYVPAYVRIPYPGGDVPADTGVCTDEIIRSYRAVGVDLQKEVHEDMMRSFSSYPHKHGWIVNHTDTNIDQRRVPNLRVFFQHKGVTLPISTSAGFCSGRPGHLGFGRGNRSYWHRGEPKNRG
jgi:uncharacterized protein YijF (DUF1287 family)